MPTKPKAKPTTKAKSKAKPDRRKAAERAPGTRKRLSAKPASKPIHTLLHDMSHKAINQSALSYLYALLDRSTLNLVSTLTGITRQSLYRWLDPNLPVESISHRDAAWFILVCETSPKLQLLLSKPKATRPHLANRALKKEMEAL